MRRRAAAGRPQMGASPRLLNAPAPLAPASLTFADAPLLGGCHHYLEGALGRGCHGAAARHPARRWFWGSAADRRIGAGWNRQGTGALSKAGPSTLGAPSGKKWSQLEAQEHAQLLDPQ